MKCNAPIDPATRTALSGNTLRIALANSDVPRCPQELNADDGIVRNDFVQIFHHIRKGNMGADGNQTDFVKNLFYIGGFQTIKTCHLYAVISQIFYFLHDILKVIRSVLQKISQAIYLNTYRQFFAHGYPPLIAEPLYLSAPA